MSNLVPEYLKEFAFNIQEKANAVTFMIKCKCGNSRLHLFENIESADEKYKREAFEKLLKQYNKIYYDENGQMVLYSNGFLGFGKKQKILPKESIPFQAKAIKATCVCCGRDILLFDNRTYGYDAVVEPIGEMQGNLEYTEKKLRDEGVEIFVKIRNDLSEAEFMEIAEGVDSPRYADAFSDISIYAVFNGKKKLIYDEETA